MLAQCFFVVFWFNVWYYFSYFCNISKSKKWKFWHRGSTFIPDFSKTPLNSFKLAFLLNFLFKSHKFFPSNSGFKILSFHHFLKRIPSYIFWGIMSCQFLEKKSRNILNFIQSIWQSPQKHTENLSKKVLKFHWQ